MAISAGHEHTCALMDDSTARCWGDNTRGQRGTGDKNPLATANTMLAVDGVGTKEIDDALRKAKEALAMDAPKVRVLELPPPFFVRV